MSILRRSLMGCLIGGAFLYGSPQCRYIIQWAPSITQSKASDVLRQYHMTLLDTYKMLSKKRGALIQSAKGSCDEDLLKKLLADPNVTQAKKEGEKKKGTPIMTISAAGAEGSLEGRALLPGFLLGLLALLGREKRLG